MSIPKVYHCDECLFFVTGNYESKAISSILFQHNLVLHSSLDFVSIAQKLVYLSHKLFGFKSILNFTTSFWFPQNTYIVTTINR